MFRFSRCILLFVICFQATVGVGLTSWAEGEEDPLWNRPSFEKKVISVGHRILAANGITEQIHFRSATRDIQNATASRFGGPNTIVIYKDLLDVLDSDDELAAVLSHEIAHIIKRHTARVVPRKWVAKTALWTAFTVGGTAASLATGGLAMPAVLLGAAGIRKMHHNGIAVTDPIARPYEREADLVGLDYMVKAGYSPLAMEALMGKVVGDSGPIANFFSSHPGGTERLTYIHEAIQTNYPQFLIAKSADNRLSSSDDSLKTPPASTQLTLAVENAPKTESLPVGAESESKKPVGLGTGANKPLSVPNETLVIQGASPSPSPSSSAAASSSSSPMERQQSLAQVLLGLQPNHLRLLRMISQKGYLSRQELRVQMEYVEPETLSVQVNDLVQKRLVKLLGAEPDDVLVLTEWAAEAMKP
jgi:hypothetical protein